MANPLKKTMVYLGLADEQEEQLHEAPVRRVPNEKKTVNKEDATVTPLRRPAAVRQPGVESLGEILTVHPKQYADARVIGESFREGVPVIMNLSHMTDADARRIVDFASGLALGLYGHIERVTSKVFLLSPESVSVSGEGGVTQVSAEAPALV